VYLRPFNTGYSNMGALLYYLLIRPLSLLPLRLLYPISDGLSWLLYRLVGFRRKVVEGNLARSFPEKRESERRRIAREYYRHLCDLVFESVRAFSISEAELRRRCRVVNPEIFDPYFERDQSLIVAAGHYNNWELCATAFDAQIPHQSVGLYKPLKDAFFDRKLTESRSQFGLHMVSIREVKAYFREEARCTITLFATDQSPSNPHKAYWMSFLNQDTGVLFGTEYYARLHNLPVLYGHISKVRRGYYDIVFELVTDNPQELPEGAITEAHTRLLEADIRKAPAFWLWSHRRWKHKRPQVEGESGKPQT